MYVYVCVFPFIFVYSVFIEFVCHLLPQVFCPFVQLLSRSIGYLICMQVPR